MDRVLSVHTLSFHWPPKFFRQKLTVTHKNLAKVAHTEAHRRCSSHSIANQQRWSATMPLNGDLFAQIAKFKQIEKAATNSCEIISRPHSVPRATFWVALESVWASGKFTLWINQRFCFSLWYRLCTTETPCKSNRSPLESNDTNVPITNALHSIAFASAIGSLKRGDWTIVHENVHCDQAMFTMRTSESLCGCSVCRRIAD